MKDRINKTSKSQTLSSVRVCTDRECSQQFLLRVVNQGSSPSLAVVQYINGDGVVTPNFYEATAFAISPISQLAGYQGTGWSYVSSPGDVKSQPFGLSPSVHEIETGFSINGGDLVWMNDAFDNKQARFCQNGPAITVVFQGALPELCTPVTLQPAPTNGVQ